MLAAGSSRLELTRALEIAFAQGLISEDTFLVRVDRVLDEHLIDPREVLGDLSALARKARVSTRVASRMSTAIGRMQDIFADHEQQLQTLLALDWSGGEHELMLGRHHACDVVLSDPTVSRRHARLVYRDAGWVLQDLASTNGTLVNGRLVGRCRLRPGDRLQIGAERLRVD